MPLSSYAIKEAIIEIKTKIISLLYFPMGLSELLLNH